MKLTKEKAITIIHKSAVAYHNNLLGNNVLFLTLCDNKSDYLEAAFYPRNFKHLTGVQTKLSSVQFFNDSLDNKLSYNSISLLSDGTVELKLNVLFNLMSIHLNARMVGSYDQSGIKLFSDKFAGTVASVMGFIEEESGYFIPNTVLKEDLRKVTLKPPQRIIATFIKPQKDKMYTELSYAVRDSVVLLIKNWTSFMPLMIAA
jgi:hypothetical protein